MFGKHHCNWRRGIKQLNNFLQIHGKKYKKDIPFYFTNLKTKKMKLWGQAKIAHCCCTTKYQIANVPAREWTYM
jgi:hypothetical protein